MKPIRRGQGLASTPAAGGFRGGWVRSGLLVAMMLLGGSAGVSAGPWPTALPEEVGLDAGRLAAFTNVVGGRGCVVRRGRLVFGWGDTTRRGDVASACKPLFTHFLFRAWADGKVGSLDEKVVTREPRLALARGDAGDKDAAITWRHLANQISCYGLAERPGTAFAYNDWQIALFADLLFTNVYGVAWPEVDARVLRPLLTEVLGCEDAPSFVEFGGGRNPGRLSISPRDFARFGQLYLQEGRWEGREVLPVALVRLAVRSRLPAEFPRAGMVAVPMLAGQRTLGSRRIPDNQTEHFGSYSFLWWVNGIERDGRRHWPDAPQDTFAALGHGGMRAMVVVPSLDLVVSWNESRIDSPAKENEAMRVLVSSVRSEATGAGAVTVGDAGGAARRRVIIETDAGGDPDDEQSLVRFLLYANEWDVEGIIANRARARDGENRNPERTGLGVVRRLVEGYADGWTNLVAHDPRYPEPGWLRERTVAGYDDTDAGVDLLLAAVDRDDPRPVWYSDWGSDRGSATNNLRRALDRVRRERGPEGYARFKSRLRLVSADAFGPHTAEMEPPFVLWVDTWRPEMEGRRWYHRFSALTARAGGFDVVRDVLEGHGSLGARYPTNTTHPQKEGDTLSFLYLVPNGLNVPERPEWGGWGGRLGPNERHPGRPYYWANQVDAWNGSTNRDNTLQRWAADLQNDFRARLDWCVQPRSGANHPPAARSNLDDEVVVAPGEVAEGWADGSMDPDGDALEFDWIPYPEAGTYRGPTTFEARGSRFRLTAPVVARPEVLHVVLRVTDSGEPRLSRYRRLVIKVDPER